MDGAGALFGQLCPDVAVEPPIRYNGGAGRGALEELFKTYAEAAFAAEGGTMPRLDRLQDLFGIKDSKANALSQKVMMNAVMRMMKDGGGEDGMKGLMNMLGGMPGMDGGGFGGGGGGPSGGGMDAAALKQQVSELKQMLENDEVGPMEVAELRQVYKQQGIDIDDLVRQTDPILDTLDEDARELFTIFKKLLQKG
ncbi:unnamed protein product [Phaeothamnion confervicola]